MFTWGEIFDMGIRQKMYWLKEADALRRQNIALVAHGVSIGMGDGEGRQKAIDELELNETVAESKAKQSEADATIDMIRTQLRVEYAENDTYPPNLVAATADAVTLVVPLGMVDANLDGKYFVAANYTYLWESATTFTLTCANNGVIDADRTLDEGGTFAGGNS